MPFCTECGHQNPDDARFCSQCGTRLAAPEEVPPSPVSDTTAKNYGEVFAPYKSKQVEGGIKWDQGDYGNTLSVFQIERPSMIKDTASNTYTDDGEQRNRGLEWNTFGQIGGQLRLLGGAAYTEGKMRRGATAALRASPSR